MFQLIIDSILPSVHDGDGVPSQWKPEGTSAGFERTVCNCMCVYMCTCVYSFVFCTCTCACVCMFT